MPAEAKPSSAIAIASQATTSKLPTLKDADGYRLWAVRYASKLKQMKAWDVKANLPLDTEESNNFLMDGISDCFLEQLVDTDLQASTIWAYFAKLFLVSSLSSKSTAVINLMNFNYSEPTMLENQTALLGLGRALRTAFSDSKTIAIDDLVTLFALVNVPGEYQTLRTTLEETKKEGLTTAHLFESLIREETVAISTSTRASRASFASPGPAATGNCIHKRESAACWTCHPDRAPTCQICKKAGMAKFRHPVNGYLCREQQKAKPESYAKAAAVGGKKD